MRRNLSSGWMSFPPKSARLQALLLPISRLSALEGVLLFWNAFPTLLTGEHDSPLTPSYDQVLSPRLFFRIVKVFSVWKFALSIQLFRLIPSCTGVTAPPFPHLFPKFFLNVFLSFPFRDSASASLSLGLPAAELRLPFDHLPEDETP